MTAHPEFAFTRKLHAPIPTAEGRVEGQLHGPGDLGVPIGGIGTGGIVQSCRGGFNRWSLKTGSVKLFREPACGFALRFAEDGGEPAAMALQPAPQSDQLKAFTWLDETIDGTYAGAFPKAWHDFEFGPLRARQESFSPVIPGDLDTASLPVAVFRWRLENSGTTPIEAAIMAHWANMAGWFDDWGTGRPYRRNAGNSNRAIAGDGYGGVLFDRVRFDELPPEGVGQFALLGRSDPGVELTICPTFDGLGDGAAVWSAFSETGGVSEDLGSWVADTGFAEMESGLPTGAIAARVRLDPGQSTEMLFSLAWDLPTIRFGSGRTHRRYYTQTWGADGRQAEAIAALGVIKAADWSDAIDAWHAAEIADTGDTTLRTGMRMNQLFLLVDGMTALTAPDSETADAGHFGLIECPDYPYYNTLDLWIYTSEGILRLWPELARSVAEDFSRTIDLEDNRQRLHMRSNTLFPIKRAGAVPHDLGAPEEDPFHTVNSFSWQDTTQWKDLNCHFVIEIARDGLVFGNAWAAGHYAKVKTAIAHLEQYDADGDGLIEHEGWPDQTFDNLPMTGPSAYCGGLWLAALLAGASVAEAAGDESQAETWRATAAKGAKAYDQALWTGTHFRFDTRGPLTEAYFVEQLFGPFLARRYGFGEIVDPQKARIALATVFEQNFVRAGKGKGAVNVTMPDGKDVPRVSEDIPASFQRSEVIVGINLSFAAQLECWGLMEEADQLRAALYQQLYEKRALFFRVPAAYDIATPTYRAAMNMRPLSVWFSASWPMTKGVAI
jgi:non-lysosomal glucosylceramidase